MSSLEGWFCSHLVACCGLYFSLLSASSGLGTLAGLEFNPGIRRWPAHAIKHYECWGSRHLPSWSFLSQD